MVGGVLALLMRAELARPGLQFLSPEQYNQLFTMHGTYLVDRLRTEPHPRRGWQPSRATESSPHLAIERRRGSGR